MKSRQLAALTALVVIAVLALPAGVAAQDNATQPQKPKHHTYKLIDMGTFGGPNSFLSGPTVRTLTNGGLFVGGADTNVPNPNYPNSNPYFTGQDPVIQHAFKWQKGIVTDLGALPGINNSFTNSANDNGLIVGVSENGLFDPFTGFPQVASVLWKNGKIINLGSLGGNQTLAIGINPFAMARKL